VAWATAELDDLPVAYRRRERVEKRPIERLVGQLIGDLVGVGLRHEVV